MKDQIEGRPVSTVMLHNRAVLITVDVARRYPMTHLYSLVARPEGTSTRWEFSAGASHAREIAAALLHAADELETSRHVEPPPRARTQAEELRARGAPPASWSAVQAAASSAAATPAGSS